MNEACEIRIWVEGAEAWVHAAVEQLRARLAREGVSGAIETHDAHLDQHPPHLHVAQQGSHQSKHEVVIRARRWAPAPGRGDPQTIIVGPQEALETTCDRIVHTLDHLIAASQTTPAYTPDEEELIRKRLEGLGYF